MVGQYFGWNQRPGGRIYVLENPGFSLKYRDLIEGKLPPGNILEPRISYDAEHYYHLYEMNINGSGLIQLLQNKHAEVKLTAEELQRIGTWIDLNAVFYGTYESHLSQR